jgi:transposase InsO family protein
MQCKRKWLPVWQRVELVELCLECGMSRRQAAAWRRVSVSTVQYWVDRFAQASEAERASGAWAEDRPSTPQRQPALSSEAVHNRVCEARRRTGWGPRLIASELGMAHATVSRCLQRRGMSRMARAPREQVRRFEWPCPGDLLQMDTKRLARFSSPGHAVTGDRYRTAKEKRQRVGWEFCHTLIDDHSRLAHTEVLGDEKAETVTAFVARALEVFAAHGITAKRLQTDNAWAYVHNRSLRDLLDQQGIQHRRIPPRTPKRNGKVERYQQTLAREWAYGQRCRNSDARTTALPIWLQHYNYTRNHSSLSNRPPISRVRNDPRHNTYRLLALARNLFARHHRGGTPDASIPLPPSFVRSVLSIRIR